MRKFYLVFVLLCVFSITSVCFALDGVGVLVLDAPVDYHHDRIAPFIDTKAMSRYSFTDAHGNYGNWKDLTDQYTAELTKDLDSSILVRLSDYVDHTSSLGNQSSTSLEAERQYLRDYFKAHPENENALERLSTYLHGTHVAGLAVEGMAPGSVRLIAAPVISGQGSELHLPFHLIFNGTLNARPSLMPGPTGILDFLKGLAQINVERSKKNIDSLNLAISEQEIGVVNLSLGREWASNIDDTLSDVIPLFIANPNTVFVRAAGNEGIDLDPLKSSASSLFMNEGIKNVVFVAALNENGELAEYSNYGAGVVSVAAQGTRVLSARSGGGSMHMDGTSMAAPEVTRKLAEIRFKHPELDASGAIQYLFDLETQRSEKLAGKVSQGRYLSLNSLHFKLPKLPKLSKLSKL